MAVAATAAFPVSHTRTWRPLQFQFGRRSKGARATHNGLRAEMLRRLGYGVRLAGLASSRGLPLSRTFAMAGVGSTTPDAIPAGPEPRNPVAKKLLKVRNSSLEEDGRIHS